MQEIEIVRAARRGVEGAYLVIFERYASVIYLFLLLRLQRMGEAEHLVGKVCERVFWSLPYRRMPLKIARLLYAIASQLSAEAIHRQAGQNLETGLDPETQGFLSCIRTLPDNYQLVVLAGYVSPERRAEVVAFLGIAEQDFAMFQERGEKMLATRYQHMRIADALKFPEAAFDRFVHNWKTLKVPSVGEVFATFFLKFAAWFCFAVILACLFLAFHLPSHEFWPLFPLFIGIVLPIAALLPIIKLAAAMDRRYAQRKWNRQK